MVHGSRTETGKPILANDTHLSLPMPSVWYETGLHGGRYDVVGFSLAGLPGVIIGHNGQIAWGITAMVSDAQDLFLEELDDEENPTRYRFMDEWRDLEVVEEKVPVKGQEEPTTLEIRHTHHGPLVNDAFEMQLVDQPPMSLSWPGHEGTPLAQAILELDRATDWPSFRQALSLWQSPCLSFVYADTDGNIGYQSTGRHPIRAGGGDGLAPSPGWTGEHEWQGFVPFEEMPRAFNPEAGFVVTANNKVAAGDVPMLSGDWAGPNRAQRITDLLAADDSLSLEEMGRIQADTYSILAERLTPYLLALEPAGDLETGALAAVEAWDLRYEPESAGAAVFHVWQWQLLRNVVGDELGEDLLDVALTSPLLEHPMTDRLMAGWGGDAWFDDKNTPEVEGRDEMAQKSLTDAVAWIAERQGGDPAEWNWGDLHLMSFVHAPFGQSGIGPLMSIFNSKPLPARGGPFTVFATHPDPMMRPFQVISGTSQRFLADLSDLSRSLAANSTGQSGHAFHTHRDDQIPLWDRVEFHPMLTARDAAEADAEGVLTLTP